MNRTNLKNNPSNPRTLSEADFKKLLHKILVFPRLLVKNKITYDSEQGNIILGGNMRFKALNFIIDNYTLESIENTIKDAQNRLDVSNIDLLKESKKVFSSLIKSKNIPDEWVQDAKGLTDEEKKAFIIIDNVSDGKWDFEVLDADLGIDTYDWGIVDWVVEDDSEVDYSILDEYDEVVDDQISDMAKGVKKAIQIEFDSEHYEEAYQLVKYWREQKAYIGGMFMEYLKSEKEKI